MFVYTDGIPEATSADNELFGTDRLLDVLNGLKDESPEGILGSVHDAVRAFVGDAPQFDDETMLCVEYRG